jgi:N-acyl-L-homoserine lactone synthetase
MQIMRLTDERELVRLFAFRYRVFVDELGWMARKDRGAHILVDEFDQESANYAAYDADGEIVGSMRVVPDGPLGLPLERCQVLNGFRSRRKRIVELSRLAVAPRWRCTMLAALLMKAGYQCAENMGATHIVLDTYIGSGPRLDRLYDKLGFDQLTEPYPDPDYLWRQLVVTFSLECATARSEWPRASSSLLHFFLSDDERIDHGLRSGPHVVTARVQSAGVAARR